MKTFISLVILSSTAALAERLVTIVNRCPQTISVFINGQTQGLLTPNEATNRTYEDTWAGLIYSTTNEGGANGAGTTRAGFYGQTNYYYLIRDPSNFNTGVSIVPRVISSLTGGFCATSLCDSISCASTYDTPPSTFPAPSGTAPAPPLFECPGTDVGYTVTFCPEKTFPPQGGYVTIHPAGSSDKCLDVRGASFRNGTTVQIYDCNGTAAQRWLITKSDSSGTRVQLAGTPFCLDAGSGPSSGTTMKIWECIDGLAAQAWQYNDANQIKFTSKNQCLDLTDGVLANGNRIQSWTCQPATSRNQLWLTS
ncbi:hypothetical protein NLJ89_g3855 [Agrocybe chaxingu]|uniref:Ricin B lectin domain-containing protein n=1 Tax=Agrocybe chaxingu TaxID=84603 RepID=A0A9W8K375_9AGAR|nr:hypothetical protein NLJ89_g3855 [Agrocybe chaxingu]